MPVPPYMATSSLPKRVSNAKTIPMKSSQKKIIKTSIRMHQEQTRVSPKSTPTYKQEKTRTTQYFMQDSSMKKKHEEQNQKSEELLPLPKELWKKWWFEKSFSLSSFNLPTFSKSRDWVTTPKLLQNPLSIIL